MLIPPVDAGTYPVTALIEALGLKMITSVPTQFVQVAWMTVAQAPVAVEAKSSAVAPLAMILGRVAPSTEITPALALAIVVSEA